ncbi:hypothetical protein GJ744_010677 [Endocarpon pusillum]|uniref:Uncharacterized protein n=1 Tax=Endocarpon pusillum TaxID=364733 RepID=A0A8H7ADZ8_9EURO|nr:hypothetical protein GJ744_010677 [Endocarpon pusillum]
MNYAEALGVTSEVCFCSVGIHSQTWHKAQSSKLLVESTSWTSDTLARTSQSASCRCHIPAWGGTDAPWRSQIYDSYSRIIVEISVSIERFEPQTI